MNQNERRVYLIKYLLGEESRYGEMELPPDAQAQRRLLRALMNVRPPRPIGEDFLRVQDEYLQADLRERGVVRLRDLEPVRDGVYIWRGDITRLAVDAIVNAANSGLTGCYFPNHGCIDNAIHSRAGVQLRLDCARLMARQGRPEPTGRAKITPAYNLPCKYVLHTVGPIVRGAAPTPRDEAQLAACYRACLALARAHGLRSVAFCCISTGEFHFPNERAAQIALKAVRDARAEIPMEVVFNVFKDADEIIYRNLLGAN